MTSIEEAFAPVDGDHLAASPREDGWRPILPVPLDAPPFTKAVLQRTMPSGYTLTATWRYLGAAGHLLGCVLRFDRVANGKPGAKQIRPLTFCSGPNGARQWRYQGLRFKRD